MAKFIAAEVDKFWSDVEMKRDYEETKRRNVVTTTLLSQQLCHVTEHNGSATEHVVERSEMIGSGLKRKIEEISGGASSEITAEQIEFVSSENGVVSDDEDETIAEQETHELLNCVDDEEVGDLEKDAKEDLALVLKTNYPGVFTEYNELFETWCKDGDTGEDGEWSEISDDDMDLSDEETNLAQSENELDFSIDSLCDSKDRTRKGAGDGRLPDLSEISQQVQIKMNYVSHILTPLFRSRACSLNL